MVFGVSYRVVGRADCPYFARAERLAQVRNRDTAAQRSAERSGNASASFLGTNEGLALTANGTDSALALHPSASLHSDAEIITVAQRS